MSAGERETHGGQDGDAGGGGERVTDGNPAHGFVALENHPALPPFFISSLNKLLREGKWTGDETECGKFDPLIALFKEIDQLSSGYPGELFLTTEKRSSSECDLSGVERGLLRSVGAVAEELWGLGWVDAAEVFSDWGEWFRAERYERTMRNMPELVQGVLFLTVAAIPCMLLRFPLRPDSGSPNWRGCVLPRALARLEARLCQTDGDSALILQYEEAAWVWWTRVLLDIQPCPPKHREILDLWDPRAGSDLVRFRHLPRIWPMMERNGYWRVVYQPAAAPQNVRTPGSGGFADPEVLDSFTCTVVLASDFMQALWRGWEVTLAKRHGFVTRMLALLWEAKSRDERVSWRELCRRCKSKEDNLEGFLRFVKKNQGNDARTLLEDIVESGTCEFDEVHKFHKGMNQGFAYDFHWLKDRYTFIYVNS